MKSCVECNLLRIALKDPQRFLWCHVPLSVQWYIQWSDVTYDWNREGLLNSYCLTCSKVSPAVIFFFHSESVQLFKIVMWNYRSSKFLLSDLIPSKFHHCVYGGHRTNEFSQAILQLGLKCLYLFIKVKSLIANVCQMLISDCRPVFSRKNQILVHKSFWTYWSSGLAESSLFLFAWLMEAFLLSTFE